MALKQILEMDGEREQNLRMSKNTKRLTSNINYCEAYCETNKARCPIYSSCINRLCFEKLKYYEDMEDERNRKLVNLGMMDYNK